MSKISKSNKLDNDEQIIAGIKTGNSIALDTIYQLYYPSIEHMITQNNGSEDEAKDIFQEAVIVLYDKVSKGNFELSSKLKTYLYSICRRLWLKQLNRAGFGSSDISGYEDSLVDDDDIEKHQELDKKFDQMEQAMNLIGEPCKTILHDFYIENHSMQDICEKFGYTNTDNAKTQKYKCLQRLKKLFFTQ
ncbi:sigma-70 family RNA polymerase sigma factor [Sphingobacterium sp. SRCM116780]|uniref:RNA polymerase sigma factor n=1 Tax=Sphingobacterium sp. SRCM116780 TaxID=2907623 RepID=UPI001F15BBF4|nr:sigma-70 family RNA polymerase sigma factor [Sphingobacterium sp. SRCM116780]UIR55329.1 sigma-70 family RNA polymerase sigma factor [Sphingobacterium sp. SRCM116780]